MMTDPITRLLGAATPILSVLLMAATCLASEFLARPTWEPVTAAEVRDRLEQYLSSPLVAPERQAEVRELWQSADRSASDADLLDRLAACLALADERVAELVDYCAGVSMPGHLPEFAWLADSETPPLVRHNMRLFLARWLAQQGYFDEALLWTDGLSTSSVVAPEALLFYRAVAHHQLVQPDEATTALVRLLQREDELPGRFQKLADLMRQDLVGLEDESLDHIARRMEDIRRRLALGRSGQRVQDVEQGVIDSLDKLIDEIEQQLQQQMQSAGAAGGAQQSGSPMEESRIAELKAPGEVERRDIGDGTGWGNLPDKDREQALQDIGREFPSHYREVIEQYFRRLAAEEQDAGR